MKKRIVFISLILALLLLMVMPASAYAGNDKFKSRWNAGITDFSGGGMLYVTYMPDPVIKRNIWCYQGEIVEGLLQQSDWDLIAGTAFWSDHSSVVRVDDEGNANGFMRGTFTLTRPDGSGVLSGTFSGRITGNLVTGVISDTGTWRSTGGTGVFKGISAWGQWSADLSPGLIPGTDIVTLIGPFNWEGKYRAPVERPVIKPWKSDKTWQPNRPNSAFKPWTPIKPGR
jgi:hypothetical protein